MSAALAAARSACAAEELPPAVAARLRAAHPAAHVHAHCLLREVAFDFDGNWREAFGGRGCSAALVGALLALGADARVCDRMNEWQGGCVRPYSMPAFAVSEAFDSYCSGEVAQCEERIAVALALLAAGAPADAPEALATWDAPRADSSDGSRSSSLQRSLAALYGAPSMPTAPPCSTLHLAEVLLAASPRLRGARRLHALALQQTPRAHLHTCPKPGCAARLGAAASP